MLKFILYPFYSVMSVLRFLNVLEPPDNKGTIPGRDYFPILSWSKIARIVGLGIVLMLFLSGEEFDYEFIMALLTLVAGEVSYRARQYFKSPNEVEEAEEIMVGDARGIEVDNPDEDENENK